MLFYHHVRTLEHVYHDIVIATRLSHVTPEPKCLENGGCSVLGWDDPWHDAAMLYEPAYEWLAKEAGFWPLFSAVGSSEEDLYMTGYHNQFRRGKKQANDVLFSYSSLPDPKVFSDYDWWHLTLHGGQCLDGKHEPVKISLSDYERRLVLKPSWKASDWLRKARQQPHSVQVSTPQLDLRTADKVRCRNQQTRKQLIDIGFAPAQVEVKRLKVPRW